MTDKQNPTSQTSEQDEQPRAGQPAPKTRMQIFREYAYSFAIAIVLALFIRSFFVQAFKIPSGSMEPTLLIGDHILVNRFIYGFRIPFTRVKFLEFKEPQREDIIVFKYPEDPSKDFIKRVIGLPGETVEIRDKKIYINSQSMEDQHGTHRDLVFLPRDISPRDNYGPARVPLHSFFVMGDNRDSSLDSRFWGFVDKKAVEGKALVIYWSWNRDKTLPRMGRMGNIIR
ncbi:MAG: signal peptidase I [Proteobacteria bacterium]|nr:signal peptidase I [Pseudomonadota bacterium]